MKNPAGKKWMAVMLSFGLAIAGWTAVPAGAEEEEIRAEGIEIPEAESPEPFLSICYVFCSLSVLQNPYNRNRLSVVCICNTDTGLG